MAAASVRRSKKLQLYESYAVEVLAMSHIYGMEKMHMAMIHLVGPGSMRCRLSNAVTSHLIHMSVDSDIPKELVDEYDQLVGTLSTGKDSKAIIASLSEIEAEKFAQKILNLHEKMAHLVH